MELLLAVLRPKQHMTVSHVSSAFKIGETVKIRFVTIQWQNTTLTICDLLCRISVRRRSTSCWPTFNCQTQTRPRASKHFRRQRFLTNRWVKNEIGEVLVLEHPKIDNVAILHCVSLWTSFQLICCCELAAHNLQFAATRSKIPLCVHVQISLQKCKLDWYARRCLATSLYSGVLATKNLVNIRQTLGTKSENFDVIDLLEGASWSVIWCTLSHDWRKQHRSQR